LLSAIIRCFNQETIFSCYSFLVKSSIGHRQSKKILHMDGDAWIIPQCNLNDTSLVPRIPRRQRGPKEDPKRRIRGGKEEEDKNHHPFSSVRHSFFPLPSPKKYFFGEKMSFVTRFIAVRPMFFLWPSLFNRVFRGENVVRP
jgi:hypothetical protein